MGKLRYNSRWVLVIAAMVGAAIFAIRLNDRAGTNAPNDMRAGARMRHGAEQNRDMFCGPRCAQYILHHYGKNERLYDLVQEIQGRDWSNGSSLGSIQAALGRRGVCTSAVRLTRRATLRWRSPVIVHLGDIAAGEAGHFVVQLPGNDENGLVRLWCGLSGVQATTDEAICGRRSGVVLLTSASEIESPLTAARHKASWSEVLLPGVPGLVFLIAGIVAAKYRRFPSQDPFSKRSAEQ